MNANLLSSHLRLLITHHLSLITFSVIRPLVGGEEESAASEKGGKGAKVISEK
jgi:hypothetical protein